ncbi:MAG: hypothetical protein HY905_22865 [Deltaproteobacteria bacterium]|nr:hypothetical protein [Deltaproteobacteria bacterium]
MAQGRGWLSENPSKAWGEKFFLLHSLVWIAIVAAVMLGGLAHRMGDVACLALGLGVFLPLIVVPLVRPGKADRGRPLRERYWLKFNVWVAIVAFVGSYFITHFFFDELGMTYGFAVRWHVESRLMDRGGGEVPVFLYFLAHVYFTTYYTVMSIGLRRVRRVLGGGRWATVLAVLAMSYATAFAETLFMASPYLAGLFDYADRSRMLGTGSAAYGLVFAATLPFVFSLDEGPGESRPLGRVVVDALAGSMLALFLLDVWAAVVGPLAG